MIYLKRKTLRFTLAVIFSCSSFFLYSQTSKKSQPALTEDGLYKIESNGLKVIIDPMMSGRVLSFKLDGKELLTGPDRQPFNYGSTFWPSPQKEWGWPPLPAIDGSPYEAQIIGNKVVLTGKKDTVSGYQLSKSFEAVEADTSIRAVYTIKNLSGKEKKVAGWEIHRVPTGGLSFFPAGAAQPAPQSTLKVNNQSGIVWYKNDPANFKETNNKLFMHGSEGWLAHVYEDLLFVKVFPDISLEQVAPTEEEVEIYADTRRGYIELENQGPFTTLQPGESLTYEVKWYLKKMPEKVKVAEGNTKLVELARKVAKK